MKDITQNITAPDRYLLRTTRRIGMLSYKSARVRYEHRTIVQDAASLPGRIKVTPIDSPRTFTRVFFSSGDETIQYWANRVVAHSDAEVDTATAKYHLKIGEGGEAIWWNASTGQWQASLVINDSMLHGPLQKDADFIYVGFLFVTTGVVPAGKGPAIEVGLYNADINTSPNVIAATKTIYSNNEIGVTNETVSDENNTAIDYRLTQVTDAKGRYNDGAVWFGDGPTSYARSAITRDQAGEELTSAWRYANESGFEPMVHAHISLREVMDMKRTRVRGLVADLLGKYKPCQVVNVDNNFHFFIGGNQSGRDNIWQANLFRINRVTDQFVPPEALQLFFSAQNSNTNAPGTQNGWKHEYDGSDVLTGAQIFAPIRNYRGLTVHPHANLVAYAKSGFGSSEWPWAAVRSIDNLSSNIKTWGTSNDDDRYLDAFFTSDRLWLLSNTSPVQARSYDLVNFEPQQVVNIVAVDGSNYISSAASAGGYLFISDDRGSFQNGRLFAINLADGQPVWDTTFGTFLSARVQALPNNECIAVFEDTIYKFDALGNEVWAKAYADFNPQRGCMAIGWDGSIYIGGDNSAMNSVTGFNKFDSNGNKIFTISENIGRCPSLGVDSKGRVLVYSRTNSKLRLYDTDGTFLSQQVEEFPGQRIIKSHPGDYGMFGS